MATLENAILKPPPDSTPVDPQEYDIRRGINLGSIPTPPDLGYYPNPASRGAVQVPDLSTEDNLRQFYRNGGAFRRYWPKQS